MGPRSRQVVGCVPFGGVMCWWCTVLKQRETGTSDVGANSFVVYVTLCPAFAIHMKAKSWWWAPESAVQPVLNPVIQCTLLEFACEDFMTVSEALLKLTISTVPSSLIQVVASSERDQVGQAWFAFCESMLTLPGRVLVIHVHRDGLQTEVFHHLSRDWCQAVIPGLSLPLSSPQVPVLSSRTFQSW